MIFHAYGLFIGLAVVVGWSVAERIEPKVNLVAPWVIGFGLIGARIWHVIDLWSYYSLNLWQIFAVWNGGMSIWGGLIGGGVGLIIARARQASPLQEKMNILAAIVTALPLSQTIGRIGNAVNGEFVSRVWILPWWGAEAILDLMLFTVLMMMGGDVRARHASPLRVITKILMYLVGYGLIRLVLQPYRL